MEEEIFLSMYLKEMVGISEEDQVAVSSYRRLDQENMVTSGKDSVHNNDDAAE